MPIETKPFLLLDKEWQPLAEEARKNDVTGDQMAILQLPSAADAYLYYAVACLSEKAAALAEAYGAEQVHDDNPLLLDLKDYQGAPLFGEGPVLKALPAFTGKN